MYDIITISPNDLKINGVLFVEIESVISLILDSDNINISSSLSNIEELIENNNSGMYDKYFESFSCYKKGEVTIEESRNYTSQYLESVRKSLFDINEKISAVIKNKKGWSKLKEELQKDYNISDVHVKKLGKAYSYNVAVYNNDQETIQKLLKDNEKEVEKTLQASKNKLTNIVNNKNINNDLFQLEDLFGEDYLDICHEVQNIEVLLLYFDQINPQAVELLPLLKKIVKALCETKEEKIKFATYFCNPQNFYKIGHYLLDEEIIDTIEKKLINIDQIIQLMDKEYFDILHKIALNFIIDETISNNFYEFLCLLDDNMVNINSLSERSIVELKSAHHKLHLSGPEYEPRFINLLEYIKQDKDFIDRMSVNEPDIVHAKLLLLSMFQDEDRITEYLSSVQKITAPFGKNGFSSFLYYVLNNPLRTEGFYSNKFLFSMIPQFIQGNLSYKLLNDEGNIEALNRLSKLSNNSLEYLNYISESIDDDRTRFSVINNLVSYLSRDIKIIDRFFDINPELTYSAMLILAISNMKISFIDNNFFKPLCNMLPNNLSNDKFNSFVNEHLQNYKVVEQLCNLNLNIHLIRMFAEGHLDIDLLSIDFSKFSCNIISNQTNNDMEKILMIDNVEAKEKIIIELSKNNLENMLHLILININPSNTESSNQLIYRLAKEWPSAVVKAILNSEDLGNISKYNMVKDIICLAYDENDTKLIESMFERKYNIRQFVNLFNIFDGHGARSDFLPTIEQCTELYDALLQDSSSRKRRISLKPSNILIDEDSNIFIPKVKKEASSDFCSQTL